MNKNYVLSAVVGVMTLATVNAWAQAPSNDECAGAIQITQASSAATCTLTTVSTIGATKSTSPTASCSTVSIDDDVWYYFTATSANVTVKASNKSASLATNGIGFTMYAGSCSGTETPECQFNAPGDSLVFHNLTVSTVYYLRTFTNTAGPTGTYSICAYTFTPPAPPANDICSNAITLTPGATCVPTSGSLVSAIQENAPDSCAGLNKSSKAEDVWYKFTPATANQTIDVTSNNVAAEIILYATCGGSPIACANPKTVGGTTTLKATGLSTSSTYFIRVYNYVTPNVTDGAFTICVHNTPAPPANDECTGAIPISTATVAVNTVGATQSTNHGSCAPNSSDDDVWYSFTANDTAVVIVASNYSPSTVVAYGASLFHGSCTSLIEDSCQAGSADTIVFHNLTIGTKYYLEVFTNGSTANGTFNITVKGKNGKNVGNVGIDEVASVNSSLNVFPNPTKDQLHVTFTASSSVTVKMINMNGQVVYLDNHVTFNGNYNKTIDMTNIAKGIYMLQITTDKEAITRKVVRD